MSFIFAEAVPKGQPPSELTECFSLLRYLGNSFVRGTFTQSTLNILHDVDMHVWFIRDEEHHNEDYYVILNLGLTMDEYIAMAAEIAERQSSNLLEFDPPPAHAQMRLTHELRKRYGEVTWLYTSESRPHLTVIGFPNVAHLMRKEFNDGARAKIKSV